MGHRTLKRVSLDFTWPLGKVWKGFLNPNQGPVECPLCEGCGHNAQTKAIADSFYDFGNRGCAWHNKITQDEVQALIDKGRLKDFTHTWVRGEGWKRRPDGYIPSAEEVNSSQRGLHSHDAINRWILVKVRAKRLGVYGKCLKCRGKGSKFPAHTPHRPYNSWRECEPPVGEGYQLWATTNEGCPISPVFPSAELLAIWCETGASIFADEKMSRQQWFEMFTGKKDLDTGSLLVSVPGYCGSIANEPVDV